MSRVPDIEIDVDGLVLENVSMLRLRLSMRELADAFTVQFNSQQAVRAGAPIFITVEGRLVLVGQVEAKTLDKAAMRRDYQITGFSSARRLVKSDIIGHRFFKEVSLVEICETICEPFGIGVEVAASAREIANEPLDQVTVDNGKKAFAFLKEVADRYGCLLVSGAATVDAGADTRAVLTITRQAVRQSPITFTYPSPKVLSIRYEQDARDIHSQYFVTPRGRVSIDSDGDVSGTTGTAEDERVQYSPLVIQAKAGGRSQAALDRQAEFEARRRAAEGARITATVEGWSPRDNQTLWWPNTLWPIFDEDENFRATMLLASAETVIQLGSGTITSLEFVRPDAYGVFGDAKIRKKPAASGEDGTELPFDYIQQLADFLATLPDSPSPALTDPGELIFVPGDDQ